jgi:molybdate transport system ATP-binding protein
VSGLELRIRHRASPVFALEIDCTLPDRGVTAIYGPSGSGKSTLLNCIAGLQSAGSGSRIAYRGTTWQSDQHFVNPWQRGIGFVFQDARLFPHLSVRENLDYAIERRIQTSEISLEKVCDWLALGDLLPRAATQLSAGQKQRVAIGRALLSAPQLLLLDEPLANLDKRSALQCLQYLEGLRDDLDLPMLYVSHNMEEVSQLADELLLISDGAVEARGSVLELCSALDTRLSHEEQASSIVLATLTQHDLQFGLSELEVEGNTLFVNQLLKTVGGKCRVRIPARDISICRRRPDDSSILNILPVKLLEIEPTSGSRVLLRLALGQQHLLARITRKSVYELDLKVGDEIFAQIKSVALLSETMEDSRGAQA